MTYVNLTYNLEMPARKYIRENWVYSGETNFFKKQVLARGGYFALTPLALITSVADTIVGVGAGVAAIATGGMHKPTLRFAKNHLVSSRFIVVRPYANLLKTLNPEAKFSFSKTDQRRKGAAISGYGDGLITHYAIKALNKVAINCSSSGNFFKRHIASRLTFALLAISSVITRIVDGIIGVIVAALSFLTLGKIESINNLAFRALQTPGIVKDLFHCSIKIINPWASTSRF